MTRDFWPERTAPMTTSRFNRQRRRKFRAERRAAKRRERHTGGDFKYPPSHRPNTQNDTWHQNKGAR